MLVNESQRGLARWPGCFVYSGMWQCKGTDATKAARFPMISFNRKVTHLLLPCKAEEHNNSGPCSKVSVHRCSNMLCEPRQTRHTCTHACMHRHVKRIHTNAYTCTHTRTHACMCTHAHTHLFIDEVPFQKASSLISL